MITIGEGSDHAQGAEEKNFHGGGGHAGMIPPGTAPRARAALSVPGAPCLCKSARPGAAHMGAKVVRHGYTLPQTPTP